MSKRVRGAKKDRISNLPDELINHIGTFVDAKSMLTTSILSRRWRYLWTSLPNNLIFCFKNFPGQDKSSKAFKKFEKKVLLRRDKSSSINKFSFSCEFSDFSIERLSKWILAVLDCHVKEVHLSFSQPYNNLFELPPSLLTSKSITVLKLESNNGISKLSLQRKIDLPSLQCLNLDNVSLRGDSIGDFLSNCPILKSLVISSCTFGEKLALNISSLQLKSLVLALYSQYPNPEDEIKIFAPNLEFFSLSDFIEREYYGLENLNALVKANINPICAKNCCLVLDLPENKKNLYARRLMEYLTRLGNVKALSLGHCFLRIISEAPYSLKRLPSSLCSLRHLNCDVWLYENCIRTMKYLFKNASNIETLTLDTLRQRSWLNQKIEFWYEKSFPKRIMKARWEADVKFKSILYHLKIIEIRSFLGCDDELRILKLLLRAAKCLEKINIVADERYCPDKENMPTKICEMLQKFPRASPSISVSLLFS